MSRCHLKKIRGPLVGIVVLLVLSLFMGCSGDDGSPGATGATGATGPAGPAGPTGPAGTATKTNESCAVCHTQGKIADITVAHPDPTGQDQTVSNIILTNKGGVPEVSFHVATDSGPVTDLTFNDVRFYIADMVPAETPTSWGTWSSPYFERWAYEQSTTSGAVFTSKGGGDYTFTFATGFGSAAALAEAPDYSSIHNQRLLIRVSGHNDASGNALTNNTVGFLDFTVPASGQTAVSVDS